MDIRGSISGVCPTQHPALRSRANAGPLIQQAANDRLLRTARRASPDTRTLGVVSNISVDPIPYGPLRGRVRRRAQSADAHCGARSCSIGISRDS